MDQNRRDTREHVVRVQVVDRQVVRALEFGLSAALHHQPLYAAGFEVIQQGTEVDGRARGDHVRQTGEPLAELLTGHEELNNAKIAKAMGWGELQRGRGTASTTEFRCVMPPPQHAQIPTSRPSRFKDRQ
ncbi:hypothetical protein OG454_29015 [Streptomyces sp. NBC_00105]